MDFLRGHQSYDLLKRYHQGWVEKYLGNGNNIRFESPQRLIKQIAWPDPGFLALNNEKELNPVSQPPTAKNIGNNGATSPMK